MRQGFGQHVKDALVEICVLSRDHKIDFLAARLCHVAHYARETPEQMLYRHHADFHDRLLQVILDPRLEGHRIGEPHFQRVLRKTLVEFRYRLVQHAFGNDQFADQIEHRVDTLCVHPQQVFQL